MNAEIRQLAELGPELDLLALSRIGGSGGNLRNRVSRWMKEELIIGVVPGIYVIAPELRKRPVSQEILANLIYGPSYVSFEYILAAEGLIPEETITVTSATEKRNRYVDTPLGRFSYRHLPCDAFRFGWTRRELPDGAGYLAAGPEKALLDLIFRGGALRSARALEERLFEDLRIDPGRFEEMDRDLLLEYAGRMPGDTFRVILPRFLGRKSDE